MKILCIIQRYFPVIGGSELLTKTYMDYLSKRHKVTVYTTDAFDIKAFWDKNAKKIKSDNSINYEIKRFDFLVPSQIAHDDSLQNFPIPSNYPGPFSPKMWTKLVLKKIDYDLIYVSSFPYDHILPAYVAAKKWNIPIIITPLTHQEFPELYFTAIRLTILNNSDGIFVISNSEKNILKKYGI
ncbi:MAG: glycosyltransferase family 4 protein, partial [Nitrosopumilus sp.]|nr:glycosyltransferase family 4 protein [Nitrosopumilus sp.]